MVADKENFVPQTKTKQASGVGKKEGEKEESMSVTLLIILYSADWCVLRWGREAVQDEWV